MDRYKTLHLYTNHPHPGPSSLESSPYSNLSSPSFSNPPEAFASISSPQPVQGQVAAVASPPPTGQSGHQRNPFIGRSACVVCGDRARGCNFGAITCASCKEFFRRNAFKLNKLKCYFQNKCDINIYSRRFCAACRLSKCYQMGMKSEYIMSDAEKYERQLKIIERKLSTKSRLLALNVHEEMDGEMYSPYGASSGASSNQGHMDMEESFQMLSNGHFIGHHHQGVGEVLVKEDTSDLPPHTLTPNLMSHDMLEPLSGQTANHFPFAALDNSQLVPNFLSSPEPFKFESTSPLNLYTNHIELIQSNDGWMPFLSPDRDGPSYWSPQSDPPNPPSSELIDEPESVKKLLRKVKIIRESSFYPTKFQLLVRAHSADKSLAQNERCKLKYLTSVIQIMQAEIVTELPTDQKCIDLMRIAEVVTFCFIKMCKKLDAFQALGQEDQVELVKSRVVEALILWSIMTINLEKECWEALDLERNIKFSLKLELLKEANRKLYEEHRKYAMSFDNDWRFNDNLMSLLIFILLFENIRNEKAAYCLLLKKYIATLYEDCQVEEMYSRLLNQLKLTKQISESHVKAYFDVSPNEMTKNGFGGLIMEIFDLNS